MNIVRWGIVGTGNIANKFAAAVKNADGAKICAVASRTEESAKAFAQKHSIDKYFQTYEQMAESNEIDAAYIAVPHNYHFPCIKLFVNAGKNVLCEKPIAMNIKELSQVQALQKEKGVFVMEAMWTRFLPVISEIKKLIDEGTIGEVLEVSSDFCYNSKNIDKNIFDVNLAGGSLLDVGVYGLTFASIFLGDNVKSVKSVAYVSGGVDERVNALLTYENGAIARFSSAIALSKPSDGYIYGSKGYIYVPNFYGASQFILSLQGEEPKSYTFPFKGNGFEEEIEEVNRCIIAGKTESDIMPLSQSERIMRIADEIRKQIGVEYDADRY